METCLTDTDPTVMMRMMMLVMSLTSLMTLSPPSPPELVPAEDLEHGATVDTVDIDQPEMKRIQVQFRYYLIS